MNAASWHLATNHLPIVGAYFATILMICGLLLRNSSIKDASLALYILTALLSVPVYLTGEGAEDVLEAINQNNDHFAHHHEDLATIAFRTSIITGIISLAALIALKKKKRIAQILVITTLVCGLISSYLMTIAGNAGGEIRHTEIRDSNADPE